MAHKILLLAAFLMSGVFGAFAGTDAGLAFERDGFIYMASPDGKNAKKLAKGVNPNLSPAGRKVAYNTEGPGKITRRRIVIRDIGTGSETVVTDIPGDNCFAPVWSPDGSKIAFQILSDDKWLVGVVNADGNGFHFMDPRGAKEDFWSPSWAPDGKSLYCQNLTVIYQIDEKGAILRQWKVEQIVPNGSMNSSGGLSISPDGKTLLLGVDMDEDVHRSDLDGPPSAIWALDVAGGRATRLSPKGTLEWAPVWIGNTEFLCLGEIKGYQGPVVYKASSDGTHRSLLLKNASSPSIAPL